MRVVSTEDILVKGTIENIVPFYIRDTKKIGIFKVDIVHKNGLYQGLWRPKIYERKISRDIPAGRQYLKETALYEVSKFFNINCVPETVVQKVGRNVGSLQLFINCDTRTTVKKLKEVLKNQSSKVINQMAFLDFVCGNVDRHFGNVVVAGNKIWLVDNGMSFTTNASSKRFRDYKCQIIRRYIRKESLSVDLIHMRQILEKKGLDRLVAGISPYLKKREIKQFLKRLAILNR